METLGPHTGGLKIRVPTYVSASSSSSSIALRPKSPSLMAPRAVSERLEMKTWRVQQALVKSGGRRLWVTICRLDIPMQDTIPLFAFLSMRLLDIGRQNHHSGVTVRQGCAQLPDDGPHVRFGEAGILSAPSVIRRNMSRSSKLVVEPSFLPDETVKGPIGIIFHVQLQLVRPPLGVDELGYVGMMQPRKAPQLPFRALPGLLVPLVVVDRLASDYLCGGPRSARLGPSPRVFLRPGLGWGENHLI